MDMAFVNAQFEWAKGNPDKLADYILTHELTQNEREYISRVIRGEEKMIDGRTRNKKRDDVIFFYLSCKCMNRAFEETHPELVLKESEIFRMIDDMYYHSEDTARRQIARAKKDGRIVLPDS